MTVLIWLVLLAGAWLLLGPKTMMTHLRSFMPGTSGSLKGEWVGHMDIVGLDNPFHQAISKEAVIRFRLSTTNFFLGNYGGTGEITIAGEPAQTIHIGKLSIEERPGEGQHYRTSITVHPRRSGQDDALSGFFAGTFNAGESLSIHRDDTDGYEMKGVLHKGTDDDYTNLVQQMKKQ